MNKYQLLQGLQSAETRLAALRSGLASGASDEERQGLIHNLFELETALKAVHTGYALLDDIVDRTSDAVFARDSDGLYTVINTRGAWLLGKSVSEILGSNDSSLQRPEDARAVAETDREVMRTGLPITATRQVERGERTYTLTTTTSPWRGTAREMLGVLGVTRVRASEEFGTGSGAKELERLRRFAVELALEDERVRMRLVADLQSGLGQEIALTKLKLEELQSRAPAEFREPLGSIGEIMTQANESLRRGTLQMTPLLLYELGLPAALDWLIEDLEERRGLVVSVAQNGFPGLQDFSQRFLLFRSVRELLMNVLAHSGNTVAEMELGGDGNMAHIRIRDAGVGFDPAGDSHVRHGLWIIGEWMHHLHGTVEVLSKPGEGTEVTLSVPVRDSVPERGTH